MSLLNVMSVCFLDWKKSEDPVNEAENDRGQGKVAEAELLTVTVTVKAWRTSQQSHKDGHPNVTRAPSHPLKAEQSKSPFLLQ